MKKKIEELFRLAMKAQEKTSAYVSFETSNHGWGCVVIIMDDGFETGREYDGYCFCYTLGTESEEKNCERSGNFESIKKISSNAAGPLHERKKRVVC